MKKIIATLAFVCVVAAGAFGQTNLLNVNKYFSYFPIKQNEKISDNDYVWTSDEKSYERFAMISGEDDLIDNPIEFALLSYYSQPVLKIRPKEADAILPANNPKLADQKLGAAVFQEIQILRFLADTAAVNRHEAVLQFITGRGNATRAEIEKFYRDNVRSLIAAVVDEEFNKVSFLLDKSRTVSYNAVLMRNPQNGQYVLTYEGVDVNYKIINYAPITATSLEALLAEMRRNTTDFSQTSIDQVRAQAALIPAVALNNVALDDVKTILTAFYTNPNVATYNVVRDIYVLYDRMLIQTKKPIFERTRISYLDTLSVLNDNLATKVIKDVSSGGTYTITSDQQQRLVGLR